MQASLVTTTLHAFVLLVVSACYYLLAEAASLCHACLQRRKVCTRCNSL